MPADTIFISYSHEDSKWFMLIKKYLKVLEHNYQLDIWDDTKIKVGGNWRNEIEESIRNCKVAILLVSTNFLSSDFIAKRELPGILNVSKRRGVTVFNILLEPSAYHIAGLDKYQCFNDPKWPLGSLKSNDRKRLLAGLADKLLEVITGPNKAVAKDDEKNVDEDAINFGMILILAYLAKNGPGSITDIQNTTMLRRRIVVVILEKLLNRNYIIRVQAQAPVKKKPSAFWKVSGPGLNVFKQFELSYTEINNSSN